MKWDGARGGCAGGLEQDGPTGSCTDLSWRDRSVTPRDTRSRKSSTGLWYGDRHICSTQAVLMTRTAHKTCERSARSVGLHVHSLLVFSTRVVVRACLCPCRAQALGTPT